MDKTPPISLILKKRYAHEVYGVVYLRVGIPGQKDRIVKSLGERIHQDYWDAENQKVKKGYPDYDLINIRLENKKSQHKITFKLSDDKHTKTSIKNIIAPAANNELISMYKQHIDFMEAPRKGEEKPYSQNYIRKWKSNKTSVENYIGNKKIRLSDINIKWLEDFELHFARTMKAGTTLHVFMSDLKEMLKKAHNRKLFDMREIEGYKWPQYVAIPGRYLTMQETDRIADLIYSGDLDNNFNIRKIACYFLIECYAGLRFSDWGKFTLETLINETKMKARTTKTGVPIYIPFKKSPRLKKIIDYIIKNDIPCDISEQDANRTLKAISVMAKIKINLTTHVGRHTCATLYGELGYSDSWIAELLGVSEKTVKIYKSVTRTGMTREYLEKGGL